MADQNDDMIVNVSVRIRVNPDAWRAEYGETNATRTYIRELIKADVAALVTAHYEGALDFAEVIDHN